jgi:hypothetical protein
MTEEEIKLRTKFYLAPKSMSIEELRKMDKKYTNYPGLSMEQASNTYMDIVKTHGYLIPDKNI